MKKTITKFIRENQILLSLVIFSIAILSIGLTYAAYPNRNNAKVVVARDGDVERLFSSNYLKNGSLADANIFVASGAQNPGDTVTICNYSQDKPVIYYQRNITYRLDMELMYYDQGEYRKVAADNAAAVVGDRWIKAKIDETEIRFDKTNYTWTTTEDRILLGRQSSVDKLQIVFSDDQAVKSDMKKLYLHVTATPASSFKDIEAISGRIGLSVIGEENSFVWSGYFNETNANNENAGAVSGFDGYNYVIEGVGSGSITLSWNSKFLELNERFIISELGQQLPTDENGWKTITFHVNSNDQYENDTLVREGINRYDLQFYKTGDFDEDAYDNWAELKAYVSCIFHQD